MGRQGGTPISGLADTGSSPALLPLQAQATFRSVTVVVNGRDDFTLENYRRVGAAVQPRPVAGARRAIPRTIHGVRLTITSTARSERRIAVRRSGVRIDASSASADPARAPWRSTAKSCQVPGTPRSSTLPRSSKAVRR